MYSACGETGFVAKVHELRDPWLLPPATHNTYPWESSILAMKTWNQSINSLVTSLNLLDAKQEIVMRTTSADLRRLSPDDKHTYEGFLKLISLSLHSDQNFSNNDVSAADAEASEYYTGLLAAAETRQPFKSDKGYLGIALEAAEVGDIICIFHGAMVPYILRPEANGRCRILGEAYVDGIMDGQFMHTAHDAESFVFC